MMRRLYLVLVLLLTRLAPIFTQPLHGTVSDAESKEPLIGANLYVKSGWRKGTSTDLHGRFTLSDVKAGDSLIISFIGYQDHLHVVSNARQISIALIPNTLSMDAIVVSAEKLIAEEFTYKKVSRLEVYLNPSAKADPLLAVNSLPAATTLDESANVSFRGSSPAETGLFFNNVPLYDAVRFSQLNGIGTFSIFNTAIVNEMLVFPGNPPLEYGNTTSGLVAIQTAEEIPERVTNTITLSPASYGALTQRKVRKKGALTMFSNFQPSSVIKGLNPEALEDIKKFQSSDLGIHYLLHLKKNTILKVFNYSLAEGYDFAYQTPTFNGTFRQRKRRNFTIANFRQRLDRSEWSLNSNLSFSRAEFGYADTDIRIDNFDAYISANYRYHYEQLYVKTGITIDYRQQKFGGTYYTFDFAEGPGFPTSNDEHITALNRPEWFLYTRYRFGENIILGGGLRKNLPTSAQDHYLSLQANVKTQLNTQTQLIVAWGKYHKYSLPQNDIEKPFLIESDQLSADIQWRKNNAECSAALFGKKTRQLGQTTELYGLEAFLKGKILRALTGQISYSLINGTTTDPDGLQYDAAYDLDYFIRGNLEYKFAGGWTTNANFTFRHGRNYQPVVTADLNETLAVYEPQFAPLTEQERFDDYAIVDLSISRLITLNETLSMVVFGSVANVFDIKNIRSYIYNFDYSHRRSQYFSRRTLYFGLVINF